MTELTVKEFESLRKELEVRLNCAEDKAKINEVAIKLNALKDSLAREVQALNERLSAEAKVRDEQRASDRVHFDALNGEQARLAADRERFIPREIFDQRHAELQREMANTVKEVRTDLDNYKQSSLREFNTYKESTLTALTLAKGTSFGIGKVGTVALAILVGL